MILEPVTLEGRRVRLEPLSFDHHAALCEAGLDPEIWKWTPLRVTTPGEMRAYIATALEWQAAGTALPFATILDGRAVGSTRFMNIDKPNRHVEIGGTWIGRPWQRSVVNTEAKYLMLRHAFETLGCMRVELKTDSMNRRSRNAIRRIGAREEGIFRNHMITWSGRIRHSAWYSIIDAEWSAVKANLEAKMARAEPPALRRVDVLSESQIEDLHRMYQNEWWTKGRTIDDVRRMLDATRIQVAFADPPTGRLVAFARAITDLTYKALILDVIVDASSRSTGLGRALMDAMISHPELASVRHFELYCRPEMIPFYERWGFKEIDSSLRFLRRG
jgi:RimJ/RimL family protein N-acetyltransferase/GNAT superfamily N-acetyltransferase